MLSLTEQLLAKRPDLLSASGGLEQGFRCLPGISRHIFRGRTRGPEGSGRIRLSLEKVKALLASIRKNEKMNALDFEIVDEKERKEERTVGKGIQKEAEGREIPGDEVSQSGRTEEGIRPMEREREYEPERGMGM